MFNKQHLNFIPSGFQKYSELIDGAKISESYNISSESVQFHLEHFSSVSEK